MVEVDEPKKGEKKGGDLRERVASLTRELDELDGQYHKACQAFQGALAAVAGISSPDIPAPAQEALDKLKKVALKRKVEPKDLERAVDALKTTLIAPRKKGGRGVEVRDETPRLDSPEAAVAGRHVAMALLSGLHMGDPAFDDRLEKGIAQITKHMAKGAVRPAMGVVAELLAWFHQAHDARRQAAETALKEVLSELVNTEEELAQAFHRAQDSLAQAGQDYEQSVTASVGRLAQEIKAAKDIDSLKTNVLEHIRALRDGIRTRRAQERELLSQTKSELDNVRQALTATKRQMQAVEKQSQEYSRAALTDTLTKVWNKRALSQRLNELLGGDIDTPLSLIFFDIDRFKQINDTYGHQAGDRALKAIAEQASASLRQKDTLYRYAGDEFVILLEETDINNAVEVAERVRKAAEDIKFTYRGQQEMTITVSMGVSQAQAKDTPAGLLERADQALYGAKQAGRNRVMAG